MIEHISDDEIHYALAWHFRDWVHQSPLSKCNSGSDTCRDWALACELADIAMPLASKYSNIPLLERLRRTEAQRDQARRECDAHVNKCASYAVELGRQVCKLHEVEAERDTLAEALEVAANDLAQASNQLQHSSVASVFEAKERRARRALAQLKK